VSLYSATSRLPLWPVLLGTLEINFEINFEIHVNLFLSKEKIFSVNSQLSKEINFESVFRNLEHVLFCEISRKKFRLWSTLIGQSATVYKHRTKR